MQPVREVPNIPLIDDRAWNSALVQIQQPFLRLGKFDDAVETQILSLQGHWTIILHWVIRKKWQKKHKIPGNKASNKGYEPLGELYFRILELCIQVHPYDCFGYLSASDWFTRIITHERNAAYQMIFTIASGARESPTKTEVSNNFHQLAVALNKFRYPYDPQAFSNPYDPVEDPHMYRLIASAVQYGETADRFRDDYWKPLATAFDLWAKDFSKSIWNVRYAKDGTLKHTSSQGRNRGLSMKTSARYIQECHTSGYIPKYLTHNINR